MPIHSADWRQGTRFQRSPPPMGKPIPWRTSPIATCSSCSSHAINCPYVTGSDEVTQEDGGALQQEGRSVYRPSTRTARTLNPTDDFAHMVERMKEHSFPWIYARDLSQEVALGVRSLERRRTSTYSTRIGSSCTPVRGSG